MNIVFVDSSQQDKDNKSLKNMASASENFPWKNYFVLRTNFNKIQHSFLFKPRTPKNARNLPFECKAEKNDKLRLEAEILIFYR